MPEIPAQTISFIVMIGLNLLTSILAISEYRSNRITFLKMVAIGQTLALLWHIANIYLTFFSQANIVLALSATCIFASSLFFLAAVFYKSSPEALKLTWVVVGYAIIIAIGMNFSPTVLDAAWWPIFGLVLYTPVATIQRFQLRSKWLLAALQLSVALTLIIGIPQLNNPETFEIAAFFYFLVSIFQPLITIVYITSAIRLSRLEFAKKENEYRLFFESVKEVFFRIDKNGRVTAIAPTVSQFNVTQSDIIGQPLAAFLTEPQSFRNLLQKSSDQFEAFQFDGAFKTNQGKIDCCIVCSPINDNYNKGDFHFVGSIRNTHERNLLEQQFIDAQRRESLGVLAGGVAHDFNNILQGILGHAELLRDYDDLGADVRKQRLGSIVSAAESAGTLCRQLLLYTGRGFERKEEFDLRDTLHEVIDILRPSHSEDIKIELKITDSPARVFGGKSQIGQIFLNLIKNAMDALGSSGTITVTLRPLVIAESEYAPGETGPTQHLPPGRYFQISVQDDGPGIDSTIQQRIFDPFFTTKQDGQGLGLAAVSGILKDHKGAIELHSESGRGATFTVLIPQSQNKANKVAPQPTLERKQSKQILLVDDDPEVRNVAASMLERAGHLVTEAFNGVHALEVIATSEAEFDLMVTDIRMPEMDGVELARRMAEQQPDLPIILSTGYADLSEQLTPAESAKYTLLRKPYRSKDLIYAVEQTA